MPHSDPVSKSRDVIGAINHLHNPLHLVHNTFLRIGSFTFAGTVIESNSACGVNDYLLIG